jgi:glycine betaine catabolism A
MKPRSAHGQHALAAAYFDSDEIWRREHAQIFRQSWSLVGHVSDVPERGSYFLHEVGDDSVIVVRDDAGKIHAHHNVCRHRGTRLCSEARGQLDHALRCSYHAWTYALDGALQAAPHMQAVAGFDKAAWPLKRAALAEWRGFLFVNLAAEPQPFDSAMGALTGRFAHWPLEVLRSVHQAVYEVEANWKLLFHNFSECYHCPAVHPHLNKLTPYRNSENDLDEGAVLGGPMTMVNAGGSMTLYGATHGARCAPTFTDLTAAECGRVYYYTLFPSAFLSLHPDYVMVHRAQPLAIGRTRVTCDWYFHPEAIAAPGFDPQPAIAFWDLTNRQDWALCENAARGMRSSAWTPGPYSELESQLAAFDRHYLRTLGADR